MNQTSEYSVCGPLKNNLQGFNVKVVVSSLLITKYSDDFTISESQNISASPYTPGSLNNSSRG